MTGHKLGKTTRGIIGGGIAALLSPILGPVGTYLAIGEDRALDDETLLAEVRSSFDKLLEKTDDAIAEVGSGSIAPLDLPGAVVATRASLPAPLQVELDRMKQDHEVFKFAVDMALALGIAVLTGLTSGLAGIGLAGWAAASGSTALALGAGQLAAQAKDMLDRQALASAATNPEGELLGVSAAGTLEKVLFGIGVVLTAVDLAGVVQEIKTLKPHFAEEPHVRSPLEEGPPEEPGAGEREAAPKTGADEPRKGGTIDEDTIKAEGLAEETFEHGGHTYQILKDGRIVQCSKHCIELEKLYGDLFERYPHLNDELAKLRKLKGRVAGQKAAELSERMQEIRRFDQMSTKDLKELLKSGELETAAAEDAGFTLFKRRGGKLSFEQWVFKSRMEYGVYVYRLVDQQGNILKWGVAENPFQRIKTYRSAGEEDFFEMQVMGGPYARPQALGAETFEAGELGGTGLNVREITMKEMGGGEWYGDLAIPTVPPGTKPMVTIRK
jgi:hypothetical protein